MSDWSEAVKEAFVSAKKGAVLYETLHISHATAGDKYVVNQRKDKDLPLTLGGEVMTFKASGFQFTLPPTGENGTQELKIGIQAVDREIVEYLQSLIGSPLPATVYYRPYLNTDLTQPQLDPPLTLTLKSVVVKAGQVQASASFVDVLNKPFPNEYYTRERFPSLGN